MKRKKNKILVKCNYKYIQLTNHNTQSCNIILLKLDHFFILDHPDFSFPSQPILCVVLGC